MWLLSLGACVGRLFAGNGDGDEPCASDCGSDETEGIGEPDPDGYTIQHFPLDGLRRWEYTTDDPLVSWIVVGATRFGETAEAADSIYQVDYDTDCEETDVICVGSARVRTYDVQNDVAGGLVIHGYNEAGLLGSFNPPLPVAVVGMGPGDELLNIVNGDTWTTTLVDIVPCQTIGSTVALDCLHFVVENLSGTGDLPVQGDWWLAEGVGLVGQWLDLDADTMWALQSHYCLTECDGIW